MRTIAILGGGVWAPRLCQVIAQRICGPGRIRISARRADRLRTVVAEGARLTAACATDWRVDAAASVAEAVCDADAIVVLIRVGGLSARQYDETFPLAHGVVGDEGLGPGGIANAYRSLPAVAELADEFRRLAPRVPVANLIAPLGVTTRVFLDYGLQAVGVCELPGDTEAALGAGPGDGLRFGGLNHVSWFWPTAAEGRSLLECAAKRGLVDPDTLQNFGAAPLRYWYEVFAPPVAARMGFRRDPRRAAALEELSNRLLSQFAAAVAGPVPPETGRPTPWFERAVAPMLATWLDGEHFNGFVNVSNRSNGGMLIPELPPDVVVEVRATTGRDTLVPVAPGPLPARVASFLLSLAKSDDLAYRGAVRRDPSLIRDAIEALPLGLDPHSVDALARIAVSGETIT